MAECANENFDDYFSEKHIKIPNTFSRSIPQQQWPDKKS